MRELQNRIHRAKLTSVGGAITAEHLGLPAAGSAPAAPGRTTGPRAVLGAAAGSTPAAPVAAPAGPADPERAAVEEALLKAGGVVSRAAAEMGLSRQALYRRMERVGIVLERRPKV